MVGEPANAASFRGVNELRRVSISVGNLGLVASHLVLLQHHEVEMADALFCILPHAFQEGWLADDVADVFVDEGISVAQEVVRHPTPSITRNLTYLRRSSAARSPKPFFSVCTMCIGAYCLRWNLIARS